MLRPTRQTGGSTAIGHRPVMKRENPTNYILFIGLPFERKTRARTSSGFADTTRSHPLYMSPDSPESAQN